MALNGGFALRSYPAVVEKGRDTGLDVGYVPGFVGAHSQGATLDELQRNLQEVIAMLLEDPSVEAESDFVGIQAVQVA
jgi:predicted RNase H-like HicB family nuclease